MARADPRAALRVSVAYSPAAGVVDVIEVSVPPGTTAAEALQLSGLSARHPALNVCAAALGVWGVACAAQHLLRDGDRVEVYRALRVDPKEARRERYRKDRGKGTSGPPAQVKR